MPTLRRLVADLREAGQTSADRGANASRAQIADAIERARGELDPGEPAMLRFSTDLALWPRRTRAADHAPLREAGLDDRAIHDVVQVVCMFSWMNRMADGLGVRLEERKHEWAAELMGSEALADHLAWAAERPT